MTPARRSRTVTESALALDLLRTDALYLETPFAPQRFHLGASTSLSAAVAGRTEPERICAWLAWQE